MYPIDKLIIQPDCSNKPETYLTLTFLLLGKKKDKDTDSEQAMDKEG